MAVIKVKIEALSPIHLSSGRADVTIDAEVIHDKVGLPIFPGRRLKGLLYESALEIVEMAGMECFLPALANLFHRKGEGADSACRLVIHDLQLSPAEDYEKHYSEWQYLQEKYGSIINPLTVLENYTSIRFQTKLENGVAADGSLRNLRVVDAGTAFYGTIELENAGPEEKELLALAMRNLRRAGMKRNRGFGRIECSMELANGENEEALLKAALQRMEA